MRKYYVQTGTEDHQQLICCLLAANKKEAQLTAAQLAYPNLWNKLGWLPAVYPADTFTEGSTLEGWQRWLAKNGDINKYLRQPYLPL